MKECYLCGGQAEIHNQDYGRRQVVKCPCCVYYEITQSALSKIQMADFMKEMKTQLAKNVKEMNEAHEEPLISLDDGTLKVSRAR